MKPKHAYLASAAIWALLCVAHYVVHTLAVLAGPRDGDLYAYSWSFQAITFALVFLPIWFIALCIVIAAEMRHFSLRRKNEERA